MEPNADIAERIGAHLLKGGDEPYTFAPGGLDAVRALLAEEADRPEFDATIQDVFRFAHFLATKLDAPEAGRGLLAVGLAFRKVDDVFPPAPGARVDDATWRRLLGTDRDPRPVGSAKVPGAKKPWEVFGS